MDLADLSRFMAVCQARSLSEAAAVLGTAPSSLSESLKALEGELGVTVFDRARRGLTANASTRWLFREGLNMLHAEAFARRVPADGMPPARLVAIDINMDFTIGHLAQAVGAAMDEAGRRSPGACFTVRWREGGRMGRAAKAPGHVASGATVGLHHQAGSLDRQPVAADEHQVALDPLVLLNGRAVPPERLGCVAAIPVRVPRVHGVPPRWLKQRLATLRHLELSFTDDDPACLETLLMADPAATFLVPSSMVPAHLGRLGASARPLDPAFGIPVVAALSNGDPAAAAFVGALREALAEPGVRFAPRPELTARQLDTFELLRRSLSVTGAAKLAGVAQPAVTEQLGKLEATLARTLFERSRDGLSLTRDGHHFEQAAAVLNAGRLDVVVKRPRAVGQGGGRLELGILPSVGPGSFLVARVARAVEAWRQCYPTHRLRILEQPNVALQERVRRGTLDLGIITTRSPRMARFDLGSSEALAFIANPAFALVPAHKPIEFDTLATLPLALPTAQFGLRQLIDAAGHTRGVTLRPAIEVDSLAMCLALVREGPLGTILPPSDVTSQTQAGELSAHPILNPRIVRTLQIIYSADRTLTEAERDLVKLLRVHFAADERSMKV